ncbi:hypothetical protein BDZ89DRAFT_1154795 [Hymenopellis radicata]|nr:hypothetical protein BDZ89DRAFT_1154795 [Hymenopellis radicata]
MSPSPTTTPTNDDVSSAPAHVHAHAHDVSVVTADALPATLHAGTFLADLRQQLEMHPTSEYVSTTAAPWAVYDKLVKLIDELRLEGTLRSLRLSYFSDVLLVEYMPTASHEQGHAGLINLITATVYCDMGLAGHRLLSSFTSLGSTRYTDQQRGLEGDSAIALNDYACDGPTLVIECGGSQSYPSLHRKGMAWFGFSNVQVVILVNLQRNTQRKTVTVEIFQRLAPAAIANVKSAAAQLKATAGTQQEKQTAEYRIAEAAIGAEILMTLGFSSNDFSQITTDLLIPYSGLFGNNIPTWAPGGRYWTVSASDVVRWAAGLINVM